MDSRLRATDPFEPRRGEVDGLPVLWVDAPGPFSAGLVFRVGRADETYLTNGISHMVERVGSAILDVLERICTEGPPADDADRYFAFQRYGVQDPARVPGDLDARCVNALMGLVDSSSVQWWADQGAVTPEEAGGALAAALRTSIVIGPHDLSRPVGYHVYPETAHRQVRGDRFAWWPELSSKARAGSMRAGGSSSVRRGSPTSGSPVMD